MSEPLPELLLPPPPLPSRGAQPLRWGFVGAGCIAGVFAECLHALAGHTLVAVGARDQARAADFARRWGAGHATDRYSEVWENPEVDVVYINTTHPFHRDQALAAIAAGKHVLVEKPAALTAEDATEVFDAARSAGVLSMEAMWMRTQPLMLEIRRLVSTGLVGNLVRVQAEFPVPFDYDPAHRLFDRANGGGALLDLGVYPSAFAWMLLGQPQSVQVMGSLTETGVDHVASMQWGYDSGAVASVFCTSQASGPSRAVVMGRAGWISVEPPFAAAPTTAVVHVEGEPEQVLRVSSRGYAHQAEEVARCIAAGEVESAMVPHADTIGVLEIIDCARSELGVRYPQEADAAAAGTGGS